MKKIATGGEIAGYGAEDKYIHVSGPVADIRANLEDRNRTAPFPWCGNRFEFRAVGGNQHIAFPLAMVNAAIAESLLVMCDEMDSGADVDQVIRETIRDNQGALFSGNGYSSELYEFAEKHELFHLENSPAAYQELTSAKNVKLFTQLGIFNEREIKARQSILLEAFATDIQIEARTLLDILQTQILPIAMQDVRLDSDSGFMSKGLSNKKDLVQKLLVEVDKLADVYASIPKDDATRQALYAQETIKPAMESARIVADRLEGMVDRRLWPLPTYSEMVHHHQ